MSDPGEPQRPVRLGYWQLDEVTDGGSPELGGGEDLLLSGDAYLYTADLGEDPFVESALVGDGHLVLDGVDDWAQTDGPVAVTDGSFVVAARVRLSSVGCGGRDMAVLSQAGATASGFVIRCGGSSDRWELVLPHSDSTDPEATVVINDAWLPFDDQTGQHLAAVYDASSNEVRFCVNGNLSASAIAPYVSGWQADGPLQVGRALHDGSYGQYFVGVVDEVRVYAGVADQIMIQMLASAQALPDI